MKRVMTAAAAVMVLAAPAWAEWIEGPPAPPPANEMIASPAGAMIVRGGDDIGLARSRAALEAFFTACPGLSDLRPSAEEVSAGYRFVDGARGPQALGWRDTVSVEIRTTADGPLMYTLGGGGRPGILAAGSAEQAVCGWPTNIERMHSDFFTPLDELSVLDGRED